VVKVKQKIKHASGVFFSGFEAPPPSDRRRQSQFPSPNPDSYLDLTLEAIRQVHNRAEQVILPVHIFQ